MTLVIGGAERVVRRLGPSAVVLYDSAHIVFCFLDVYPVFHGGGLTTKRRQPLWIRVQISESTCFRTHVHWTFFLFWWVLPTIKIIFNTFYNLILFKYCLIYTDLNNFRSTVRKIPLRLLLSDSSKKLKGVSASNKFQIHVMKQNCRLCP